MRRGMDRLTTTTRLLENSRSTIYTSGLSTGDTGKGFSICADLETQWMCHAKLKTLAYFLKVKTRASLLTALCGTFLAQSDSKCYFWCRRIENWEHCVLSVCMHESKSRNKVNLTTASGRGGYQWTRKLERRMFENGCLLPPSWMQSSLSTAVTEKSR